MKYITLNMIVFQISKDKLHHDLSTNKKILRFQVSDIYARGKNLFEHSEPFTSDVLSSLSWLLNLIMEQVVRERKMSLFCKLLSKIKCRRETIKIVYDSHNFTLFLFGVRRITDEYKFASQQNFSQRED